MPRKDSPTSFEQALAEFERLVERMEKGDLSLEESLQSYERGMDLSNLCQRLLDQAEQRVEVLSKKNEKVEIEPFETDEQDPE